MGLLWFRRSRRNESTGAEQPERIEPRADEPQPRAPARLRGLLLLNLQPSDGREQIEHAPPLGSRDVVMTAVRTLVPGMRFDEGGYGTLEGAGHRVILEIGTANPVPAAVAAAEGDAGVELLRSLVHNQGWRVYAPRAGVFIEADALDAFAAARSS